MITLGSPKLTRPIRCSSASFTIGQRGGLPGGFSEPMYVTAILPETRAVVIGTRGELLGSGLVARGVNWLVDPPSIGTQIGVRIRHRSPIACGEIIRSVEDEIEIALDEPVPAITPGQSVVLYDGSRVLGGGFIERSAHVRAGLPVLAA